MTERTLASAASLSQPSLSRLTLRARRATVTTTSLSSLTRTVDEDDNNNAVSGGNAEAVNTPPPPPLKDRSPSVHGVEREEDDRAEQASLLRARVALLARETHPALDECARQLAQLATLVDAQSVPSEPSQWNAQHQSENETASTSARAWRPAWLTRAVAATVQHVPLLRRRTHADVTFAPPPSSELTPFSLRHPPPTVTQAEVDAFVGRLSADEVDALLAQTELAARDDFECISEDVDCDVRDVEPVRTPPPQHHRPHTSCRTGADTAAWVHDARYNFAPTASRVPEPSPPSAAVRDTSSATSSSFGRIADLTSVQHVEPVCTIELEYAAGGAPAAVLPRLRHDLVGDATDVHAATRVAHAAPTHTGDGVEVADWSFETFSRRFLGDKDAAVAVSAARTTTTTPAAPLATCDEAVDRAPHNATPVQKELPDDALTLPAHQRRLLRRRAYAIVLGNKIRERDVALLTAALRHETRRDADRVTRAALPAVRRVMSLLGEAQQLLDCLGGLDRAAQQVEDSAEYLHVPRYRACCSELLCRKPFSATTLRVLCRRCGQFFCPSCCGECGIGPTVMNEVTHVGVSLGWELICRRCWKTCAAHQKTVAHEQRRRRLVTAADAGARRTKGERALVSPDAVRHTELAASSSTSELDVGGRGRQLECMTLQDAVLSGAYCGARRRLRDGMVPFYVVTDELDTTAGAVDTLSYVTHKLEVLFRLRWQDAGRLARDAVTCANVLSHRQRQAGEGTVTAPPRH